MRRLDHETRREGEVRLGREPLQELGPLAAVGRGLGSLGVLLTLVFAGVIFLISAVSTAAFDGVNNEHMTLFTLAGKDFYPAVNGVLVGLLILLGLLALRVRQACERIHEGPLLAAVMVVTGAFGVWWVLAQGAQNSLFPDSRQLIDFARHAAAGDWTAFELGPDQASALDATTGAALYFTQYPFQAGIFWYFFGIFRLFGAGGIVAIQLLNVLANEVVLLAVWGIGRTYLAKRRQRLLLVLLLGLCSPLVFSASMLYGNSVGLAFACGFLWCQAKALAADEDGKGLGAVAAWLALSVVPLAPSLVVKSTYVLLAIAAAIVWLIRLLRHRSWVPLVLMLAVMVAANAASAVPTRALEAATGSDFGPGMPKTSWMVIGLSDGILDDMPGWWDAEAIEIQRQAHGDYAEQQRLGLERISQHVGALAQDPARLVSFFASKLCSEWSDPTYGSLYYSSLSMLGDDETFDPYAALGYVAPGHALVVLMDGYQLAVYLGALVAIVNLWRQGSRRRAGVELLLVAVLFTGFGCYLLWEAKSIYLLPFFVLMLPLAARGLDDVVGVLAARRGRA